MMPKLYTPVDLPRSKWSLTFAHKTISFGSCFADEMAMRMAAGGFQVMQNPFGTLYNPASIAQALGQILDEKTFSTADLVEHEGMWHSWYHHSRFSRGSAEACIKACNDSIRAARIMLSEADYMLITFGTAWVFECIKPPFANHPQIVANCHKLPASYFLRRRLTSEEITAEWKPLMQRLHSFNERLKIIFTVSPIRHWGDGAHGNQLSKGTLLLAVDELMDDNATYFPAYEIVLDELRDYRFYAPDMQHPSPLAADIVWHHFQSTYCSPEVVNQAHLNSKQRLKQQHIPIIK